LFFWIFFNFLLGEAIGAGGDAGIDTYREVVDEAIILATISLLLPSPPHALPPPPCR